MTSYFCNFQKCIHSYQQLLFLYASACLVCLFVFIYYIARLVFTFHPPTSASWMLGCRHMPWCLVKSSFSISSACLLLSSPSPLVLTTCSNPLRIFLCCVALYSVDIDFIFNSRHNSVGVYFISHRMDTHFTVHTVGVYFILNTVDMYFYTSQCGNAFSITQYRYLFISHKVKIPCHSDFAFFLHFSWKVKMSKNKPFFKHCPS